MITKPQIWRAFAKVNRELRVLGERGDGYHEIRSVLETIDLHDEIRLDPSDTFRFTASSGPSGESNLVVRAVKAFEQAASREVRMGVELVKRIPAGAGLGGGSADAAVMLLGLARLARLEGAPLDGERLQAALESLGSDVPFFAVGGRALAAGRGERLFPLEDGPDSHLLLVHPELEISTAEAYSWLTTAPNSTTMLGFCARFAPPLADAEPAPEARLNDFETPLFRRFPELAAIKMELLRLGARRVALSGSGATLFGEFAARVDQTRAAAVLGQEYAVALTRPLPRAEYFRRLFGG